MNEVSSDVHGLQNVQNANKITENWVNVPTNSILTIHRQTVMVHPILDKYYERDPHHIRSSAFVQAKGLVSNEKVPSGPMTPAADPSLGVFEGHGKGLGQSALSRSISPDFVRRSLASGTSCGRDSSPLLVTHNNKPST